MAAAAKSRKPSGPPPSQPRWCDQKPGCDTRVILANRDGRWLPYEAEQRDAYSQESVGCHVLMGSQAWLPKDLIEHLQVRWEISEEKARDHVLDYPHHRPHFHIDEPGEPT